MFHKSQIIALVAICSVAIQLVYAKDIYQLCGQFDEELKRAVQANTDRDVNYNKAQELLLHTDSPLDSSLRRKLAISWETIRMDKGGANCDSINSQAVNLIRQCRPLEFAHLKATLGADILAYTEMCGCSSLWADKLALTFGKMSLSKSSKEEVENFLSKGFIEGYASNNKVKEGDDVRITTSATYYDTSVAGNVGLSALLRIYGENYKSDGAKYFESKPGKIASYIQSWLISPCTKYVKVLAPLIESAIDFSLLYAKGEREFWRSQEEFFKDSLFRYQFCTQLAMDYNRQALISAISNRLQKGV